MTIVLIVVAAFLGIAATFSAIGKLKRLPQVVETMHKVGVTDRQMPLLAVLELAGAAGLLIGIWVPILGVLASLGLTIYFLAAVIAHLRAKETLKEAAPALFLAIVAIATLVLELTR